MFEMFKIPTIFAIYISGVLCCHTFKNHTATVYPRHGSPFVTTFSGCIERRSFSDTIAAVQIHMKDENIPHLRTDDVRHLIKLRSISFDSCKIKVIDTAIFRNVPILQNIKIVNNEFTEVPKGIFSMTATPELQVLELYNNKIRQIASEAFANLTQLKEFYCDHNNLEYFDGEWFNNTFNIEMLSLQYNKIKEIPRRALCNFPKVKEVYFDYNEIETIYPEVFDGVKQLDFLGLKYNKIRSIDHRIFPNNFLIKVLLIDANFLNYLSTDVLRKIKVKQISLNGNPWNCACLNEIFQWLRGNKATTKISSEVCMGGDIPVCSFPSISPGHCVETIDPDVTKTYIDALKRVNPPLAKYCARLD